MPGGAEGSGDPLLVAAAADLVPAFELLGERFEEETGRRVVFNFGSSGRLAQQVLEGSPADLYASADVSFVERVLAAGRGDPDTRITYAFGRIVIWARADAWRGWRGLGELAADDDVRIVAIANPEHAPYGAAAREALESVGAWGELSDRLVLGDNVADTQRLVASGNADAGIVALSLAVAADERDEGRWTLIPDELHAPLQQDLVVTAEDPDRAALATRFADLVASEAGREVMRRFGFLLPGDELPGAEGW